MDPQLQAHAAWVITKPCASSYVRVCAYMLSDFDHWQTGTFEGFPELSQQSFAYVYENAPTELRQWVLDKGQLSGIRWVWDFARYTYRRAKTEGCSH